MLWIWCYGGVCRSACGMAVRRAFAGFVNIVCCKTKKTRNLLQIRKKRRNFAAANKSICKNISLTH
jgi:hypothetical protein